MGSLGGKLDGKCLETLLDHLAEEAQEKKSYQFNCDKCHILKASNIPMRRNNADCGVLALMFADYAAREAEIEFCQSDMSRFRRRMTLELLKFGKL